MRRQVSFHQNAQKSNGELNELLAAGWLVVNMVAYVPCVSQGYNAQGTILIILEKEFSDEL